MRQRQLNKIKEVVLNNPEGFTCDLKGNLKEEQKGFFVSISNIKGKRIDHLIKKLIMVKETAFKDNKNLFIGGWKNEDLFYLDLSLFVLEFETAKKIGLLFNQKAVFDLENLKEIYLK